MKKGFAAALLALACSAWAQTVHVQEPWARATVSTTGTGAFMKLTATADTRLVDVRSSVAGVAEVHEMSLQGDVMKMRAVAALPLPAGKTVELRPGGYHVMLMDLKAPVKVGDQVPLTLVFENAAGKRETQDVMLPVRSLHPAAAGAMPAQVDPGAAHR